MPLIKILRILSNLKKCNANDANFNSSKSELDSMDDVVLDRVLSSIYKLDISFIIIGDVCNNFFGR